MEHSEAYLLLELLLKRNLLFMPYVDLLELLNTLQGQGRITIEEGNELLKLGENLTGFDLAINE
jgi:hypothetical protein